jgi:glycosyltransferase involved in cell wall biosynthesis
VLYNCSDLTIFQEYDRKINHEKITICHEGYLDFSRGLKDILDVMKVLKDRYNGRFRFLIIGDVAGEAKRYFDEKIKEYQIGDIIETTGWLPYEKVGEVISDCSVGIIFLDPVMFKHNTYTSPIKMFNYMRYGLPIVTVDLPEIRRIVLESQCGIIIKERTIDSLVKALSILIEDADLRQKLGENSRKAVYEKYNWKKMEEKLLRIYDELSSSDDYVIAIDK